MKTFFASFCLCAVFALFLSTGSVFAEGAGRIKLTQPRTGRGKPLMQALKDRESSREFSSRELPLEVLSELLWAADGVNRPDGKRTAPSAMNMQEIEIYAAKADGLYQYDAAANELAQVLADDIRGATGSQPFVSAAPVNLIYVADLSKTGKLSAENAGFYSAVDTGFISQNVYLYCASEGLATVVRGALDKDSLAKAMKLPANKKVILAQTIGYPQ